jgi:phage gp36-like protein
VPYITINDLAERLGSPLYARLTDRVQGTTADDDVAAQIVADAIAEADSCLARRYRTPVDLTTHPELTTVLAARVLDLAEYLAWKGSPFVSDPPHRVHQLYATARQWFGDVATGRLVLPAAAPLAGPTGADHGPHTRGTPRDFTHDELDGL